MVDIYEDIVKRMPAQYAVFKEHVREVYPNYTDEAMWKLWNSSSGEWFRIGWNHCADQPF